MRFLYKDEFLCKRRLKLILFMSLEKCFVFILGLVKNKNKNLYMYRLNLI